MHGRIYLKLAGLDYVGEFSSCWVYFAHVHCAIYITLHMLQCNVHWFDSHCPHNCCDWWLSPVSLLIGDGAGIWLSITCLCLKYYFNSHWGGMKGDRLYPACHAWRHIQAMNAEKPYVHTNYILYSVQEVDKGKGKIIGVQPYPMKIPFT